jgi:hypothetical protein
MKIRKSYLTMDNNIIPFKRKQQPQRPVKGNNAIKSALERLSEWSKLMKDQNKTPPH